MLRTGLPVSEEHSEPCDLLYGGMQRGAVHDEETGTGIVRVTDANTPRIFSSEVMVCLVVNTKSLPSGEKLVEQLLGGVIIILNKCCFCYINYLLSSG